MPYIGRPIGVAGHTTQKLDDPTGISSNAFTMKVATVAISPDAASLQIYVDGVRQEAGVAYTVSGSTITFTGTFTSSNDFQGYVMGDAMYIQTNSVDSDHYVDGSIDNAHLADDAVDSDELAAGSVDIAHLSASGTAGSGNFLRGDNSWTAVTSPAITSIAGTAANQILTDDGDATVTSESNLTFDGTNLDMPDSIYARFGTGNDLQLYHDGSNSFIQQSGTGALKLATEDNGKAVSIGHTTSETTVNDNLTVTGDLDVGASAVPLGVSGCVVQVTTVASSNEHTSTSNAFDTDACLSDPIGSIITKVANSKILIIFNFGMCSSAQHCMMSFRRGGAPQTENNIVGSTEGAYVHHTATMTGGTCTFVDSPAQAAGTSIEYTPQIRNSDDSTAVYCGASEITQTMTLLEIV